MQVGIEAVTLLRLEFRDTVLLQHLVQLALGELNAVEQRLDTGIRRLAQFGIERLERPVHVARCPAGA